MKLTIGTYDIADYLVADTYNAWTRSGSLAMAEWLEQMEEDSGIEMEFNACEIRCEYSEYKSVMEAAGEYGWEPDAAEYAEQTEAAALQYLEERTDICIFASGVIIRKF
jgi:hypothetical protein